MTSLAINDPSDNQKKHILDPVCIYLFFFPFHCCQLMAMHLKEQIVLKSPLGLIKRFNTQHVQ